MKKFTLFFAFMALPFLMNAETYFKDGMQWRNLVIGSQLPGGAHSLETVTLQKSAAGDWLEMKSHTVGIDEVHTSDEFIGYVKSEGDKVFFKLTDAEDAESYLFYDFGLKEGEGCYVYSPIFNLLKSYVKCVGIGEDPEFPGFETMSLIEYRDDSCTGFSSEMRWIKGLSSERGVLFNNFLDIVGVGGRLLWDATYDGKTLYSNPMVRVDEIPSESGLDIRTEGLVLTVSVKTPVEGGIYSLSGVNLGNYMFGENPITISLPAKGLYILKAGEKAIKVEI